MNEDIRCITNKERSENMAVVTKPINRITVIKEKDSREFIREFNKNEISKEFLDTCRKAGKLFGKKN